MSELDDSVVRLLVGRIAELVREREGGHCAQLPHVPERLAERLGELSSAMPGGQVVVVKDAPTARWHASPSKVVELRNNALETGNRLVLIVPAGTQLPVEDSFGDSTFEVIDTDGLYGDVREASIGEIIEEHPEIADRVRLILDSSRRRSEFGLTPEAEARFANSVTLEPTASGVAAAMPHLGLIPDVGITLEGEDAVESRLRRNLQQIERLSSGDAPADRVRDVAGGLPSGAAALRQKLIGALDKAPSDRWAVANELGKTTDHVAIEPLRVLLDADATAPTINRFEIMRLEGDLDRDVEPPRVNKRRARVKAVVRCEPPARSIVGLSHLRLSLLHRPEMSGELIDVGISKTKRVGSLGARSELSWSMSLDVDTLEPGLYLLQVEAVDENNFVVKSDESDPLAIEQIDNDPGPERTVPSLSVARLAAYEASDRIPGEIEVTYVHHEQSRPSGSPPIESFAARFAHAAGTYKLVLPKALTAIESWSISAPRDPTNHRLRADNLEPDDQRPIRGLPEPFLDAREQAMQAIQAHQLPAGDDAPACIAACRLDAVRNAADSYLRAWTEALNTSSERERLALLSLDQVDVDGIDGCVLVGPTHPLRLAWLVRYASLVEEAVVDYAEGTNLSATRELSEGLTPANVPHIIVDRGAEFRYLDAVSLEWGIWTHPSSPSATAAAAELRWRLTGAREGLGNIGAADIIRPIKRYLVAHPYARTLVLNFVQAGRGDLLLDALLALQSEPQLAALRYEVRLFASDLSRSVVGHALDEFMAYPEALPSRSREAADVFLASNDDPLAPKLTYSKHALSELSENPDRFPAHLTVFVDWFELDAVPVPPLARRRSLFADGVFVDPVVLFRPGDDRLDPEWDEYVVSGEHGGAFGEAFRAAEIATARLLSADAEGAVPALRLRLDRVRRSILDVVHRTSDWVMTVDPVFTDEFLDSRQSPEDAPRYLIDSEQRVNLGSPRNIVVSTRSRLELAQMLRAPMRSYGLKATDERVVALLEALHALSPGLGLGLLNAPTRAIEALTLALTSIELDSEGTLRRCLAIPLDLHQDLFRDGIATGVPRDHPLTRTDLALVRPHASERVLDVHLVEVKARADLPSEIPDSLVMSITDQLDNSRHILGSSMFGLREGSRESEIVRWMRVRRMTTVLSRYAERAHRYGMLPSTDVDAVRSFLSTLDQPFEVRFALHAIVFDLGPSGRLEEEFERGEVRFRRITRDRVETLLESAPIRDPTRPPLPPGHDTGSILDSAPPMSTFGVEGLVPGAPDQDAEIDSGMADPSPSAPVDLDSPDQSEEVAGPSVHDVMLIGQAASSAQFGIVGHLRSTAKAVAFDVDRTNVVSVFGVQGSGKSYSVGDLIETALIREPALTRLKVPLGVVVFHFSSNQTYKPEFASMVEPNDDPEQVRLLLEMGAEPRGLDDVRLLVPRDLVTDRNEEFHGRLPVHPLVLSPDELVLNDWKLLMGVEGGEQMYVKTMSLLLKGQRRNLSISGLRAAIQSSNLSPAQQGNANSRLDFVESFVSDDGGVHQLVKPGRLLIVDVRDPLMDRDEALALFMVLLRACSLAENDAGQPFNKLIVFDEAHKYMGNPKLTGAIVEAIREMRHQGNTIVIASQDPPSVSREVIELSSVIMAHRFMSPQWLDHIKKANSAFAADIAPPQLATLAAGEAFVYSSGGDVAFRRPVRVVMRPRLTRHGGGTRRATGD